MSSNKYNLTFVQNNIYMVEKFNQKTSLSTISGILKINNNFSYEICNKIINNMIKNNDAFRLKILQNENNEVYQVLENYVYEDIKLVDMSNSNDSIDKYYKRKTDIPFDIFNDKLYSFEVIKYSDDAGSIFLKMHHIISDAWTFKEVINQLVKMYNNELNSLEENMDIPSYLEYIESENKYKESEKYLKDEEFWREYLDNVKDPISIKDAKNSLSTKANRYSVKLEKDFSDNITNFCKENRLSPYALFLSAIATYMYRIKDEKDFVIGTPVLNRSNFREKQMMGLFVSTMPVRIKTEENMKFVDVIKNVGSDTMSLFRHQKYPITKILEYFHKEKRLNGKLYNIMLSYQNARAEISGSNTYSSEWIFSGHIQDELEIHIMDMDNDGILTVNYDYLIDLFDDIEIEYFHTRIMAIINNAIKDINVTVENIDIMSEEEKNKILCEFNSTDSDYPKDKTVIEIFEEQVFNTPDNIAVIFENESLTYRELNERADNLSSYLINEKNVKSGDVVAIKMKRGLDIAISILGILKAGAVYLPIDVEFPDERIEYILKNSNSKYVIEKIPIYTKKTNNNEYSKNAYMLYTSGSTGNPKGVIVSQKNLLNFVFGINKYIKINEKSVVCSITTISFDIFGLEFWLPLLNGAKLVISNEKEQNNGEYLNKLCLKNNVDLIQTTPTKLKLLMYDKNSLKYIANMKNILLGGEAFPHKLFNDLRKITNSKIYNVYGPTETTIWSTIKELTSEDNITVGKPIANTKVTILDSKNRLLPMFCLGELCISGDGVSSGYTNKELNEKVFIENGTIYKTGDLAFLDSSGEYTVLGRNDFQVKINGKRIELQEIENKVINTLGFSNAVVNVRENKIVCFYEGNEIDNNYAHIKLTDKLPLYMIPNTFVKLNLIPTTLNGKIDRKALNNFKYEINSSIKEPESDMQRNIRKIIADITNIEVEKISVNENLVTLGLDSLDMMKLSFEISKKYNKSISASQILENNTIEMLEKIITNLEYNNINNVYNHDEYEVTPAQRGIINSYMLNTEMLTYNMPFELVFSHKININKLAYSIQTVIKSYPNLFVNFSITDQKDFIAKLGKVSFEVNIEEVSEKVYEEKKSNFIKPFDLFYDRLFRVKIYETENKYYALFDFHHIIFDGMSVNILLNNIKNMYEYDTFEKENNNYFEYANLYKENTLSKEYEKSKEYFVNKFNSYKENVEFPTDMKRGNEKKFSGKRISTIISDTHTKLLKDFCTAQKITMNTLFLASFNLLLTKYTLDEDISLGIIETGRNKSNYMNSVGMYVKTLPYRNSIDGNDRITDYLQKVQNNIFECISNDSFTYEDLIRELKVPRVSSRNPIFDILYVYQNTGLPVVKLEDTQVSINPIHTSTSKFDFTLEVMPNNNEIELNIEYDTNLFFEKTILNLLKYLKNLLQDITEKEYIKDVQIISSEEKNIIFNNYNNTDKTYKNSKIHEMIEDEAAKNPDKVAISFKDTSITYGQLNKKANELANLIIDKKITKSTIGIMMNRSLEMIISILAVLKSSNAYLPIDKAYPKDRIDYILSNSEAKLIITDKETNIKGIECIEYTIFDSCNASNKNLRIKINEDDLAYIIYTSGSTGRPKGVQLYHKSLSNLTNYCNEVIEYLYDNKDHNIVSVTTMSFDIFIFETLISLQKGLRVVIADEEQQRLPSKLNELIIKNNVDIIQTTPSRMKLLVDNINICPSISKLQYITLAGEQFPNSLAKELKDINSNVKLYNGYGPTETTVFATITDVTNMDDITIGTPVNNTKIYIMDKYRNILPIGMKGEIYISGKGVSKGYIKDKEKTENAYLQNKYDHEVIYKSGDIGKYSKNGQIKCFGRKDSQVKFHGLRIELEEIEKVINNINSIINSVVIINKAGNQESLICYYKENKKTYISDIKECCKKYLPIYMVPSRYIKVKDFPYTPNGKIDRKELEKNEIKQELNKNITKPQNSTEKQLYNVWCELLKNDNIGTNDNFFEIGGDSFLGIKMQIELLKNDISINYSDIFESPTITDLSNHILGTNKEIVKDVVYDYSLDNVIKSNALKTSIKKEKIKNIFVTGVTGFLGAHIVKSFIDNEIGLVYCLVRKIEKGVDVYARIDEKMKFFFGEKYDSSFKNRIRIVEGDITEKGLGISLEAEIKDIDFVVHSAAHVKHYGNNNKFSEINIDGTSNVIEFCKKNKAKLIHISTLSVSGNALETASIKQNFDHEVIFDETNMFIGQNVNNEYVYTKFIAETLVLQAMKNKDIEANIIRIGNLTGRTNDAKFQPNVSENAFANRIKSIIEIGSIPKNLLEEIYAEFTPIDLAAESIIKIMQYFSDSKNIFHIMNHNHVYPNRFIQVLEKMGINIEIKDTEEFASNVKEMLRKEASKEKLSGIINDFKDGINLDYKTNIKVSSKLTQDYLAELGFVWPYISDEYIMQYIQYLIDVGHIKVKKEKNNE